MSGIARIKDVLRKMGVPRAADDEEFIKAKKTSSGGGGISTVMTLTQAEYDAIVTKDPKTLYVVVG